MHLTYPKRPPFFAMHVMQALMETEAAKSMGRDACLLVAFIATYEDKLRYAKPVQFRCSHLVTMMNFRDWRGLDKARKAAIEAGWLQYEPTANGSARAAKYFVTIPSVDLDNRPLAEIAYGRVDGLAYGRDDGRVDGPAYGRDDGRVDGLAYLSILDPIPSPNPEPNPNPKKTKAAKPPSFDALDFVLPEEINTPEMQEAWRIWVQHRNEIKKRLTPTSCQQQAAQFVQWGVARSIAAIRWTVSKGWQGLREPETTAAEMRRKDQAEVDQALGVVPAAGNQVATMALHQKESLAVAIVENATRENIDQQIDELEKLFGIATKRTKELVSSMVKRVFGDDIPTHNRKLYKSNSALIMGFDYATKQEKAAEFLKSLDSTSSSEAAPEQQKQPQQRQKTQAEIELERYKAIQDAKLKNPRAFVSESTRPVAVPPPPPEEPPKPKEPIPLPTEQEIELRRKTIERLTGVAE